MSKTVIYAANTATQAISPGSTVNFGNIVRRFGCLDLSGGNVVTNCTGYYDVTTNLTIAGTVAGSATVQIYSNGVAVQGATTTVPTTATSVTQVCIPAVVKQNCCVSDTITVVITGVAVSVTNAAIVAIKE